MYDSPNKYDPAYETLRCSSDGSEASCNSAPSRDHIPEEVYLVSPRTSEPILRQVLGVGGFWKTPSATQQLPAVPSPSAEGRRERLRGSVLSSPSVSRLTCTQSLPQLSEKPSAVQLGQLQRRADDRS